MRPPPAESDGVMSQAREATRWELALEGLRAAGRQAALAARPDPPTRQTDLAAVAAMTAAPVATAKVRPVESAQPLPGHSSNAVAVAVDSLVAEQDIPGAAASNKAAAVEGTAAVGVAARSTTAAAVELVARTPQPLHQARQRCTNRPTTVAQLARTAETAPSPSPTLSLHLAFSQSARVRVAPKEVHL